MRMVALLRGINVGGHKSVPMVELRELATKLGLTKVVTYIQSGNLIFDAIDQTASQVEINLERAVAKHFGFDVDILVRSATQWQKYLKTCPFAIVVKNRPKMVHLGISKKPCPSSAAEKLTERATQNENIQVIGGALWIDFVKSAGKSKITPSVVDKAAGSCVTMRNWNTVLKIAELLSI